MSIRIRHPHKTTKKVTSRCILILFFWCFAITLALGQKDAASSKLVDKLSELEERFNVHFSYNHTFLGQVALPYFNECDSIEECLERISNAVPVNFEKGKEDDYMVLPIRKHVTFRVVDFETKELIFPIQVRINDGQKTILYPAKSAYSITDLFPLDSVHIDAGFYSKAHLIASELDQPRFTLALNHEFIQLDEVLIKEYLTTGIDAKLADHTLQVNMKSLGLLAGETDGDVFNILKNIPGIHSPSSKPGSLNFRGGTFDHTFIQIDDIPIYHNGHFFGALSPYNPTIVNNIEVQRNTLAAKWGGRVGGLLNMSTDDKVADSTSYKMIANTLYAGATAIVPIIPNKLGIQVAARFAYPGVRSPKMEALSVLNFQGSSFESIAEEINSDGFEVGFYDINTKLIYDINENHKVTLSFINIQNRLSLETGFDNDNKNFRDIDLDNWGVTAKWFGKFSEKFTSEVRLSQSSLILFNSSSGFSAGERSSFEKYTNTIKDTRLISEFTIKVTENTTFETGYSFTNHNLNYDELIEQEGQDSKRDQDGLVHSFYVSTQNNWTDIITTNIGVHTDYYEPQNKFFVDPRLSLSIKANNTLFFKASGGRSHQFVQKKFQDDFDDFNVQNQFWYLPDASTYVLEGYQAMLGGMFNKSGWLVDVELYHRRINNITPSAATDFEGTGTLKSMGGDLFIKKKWGKLETWLSYSLGDVRTEFEETTDAFFNQPQILNITGLFHSNPWDFAVSWGIFSGMPVVVPELNNPSALDIEYSTNFPTQHQVDVSATYTFFNKPKGWKGIIGLSVVNLFDTENIVNIFQNNPSTDNLYREGIGFAPNLQLSFHF